MDLVFVDVETTGLSPRHHVITDIWCERRRLDTLELLASAGGLVIVRPQDMAEAEPRALSVGHYDPIRWARNALPFDAIWKRIAGRVLAWREPAAWVGHNVAFDLAMIDAMLSRYGLYHEPRVARIDTLPMAHRLKDRGIIRSASLSAMAEHYGLPHQDHSAQGDVALLVEVYRRLTAQEVA